VSAGFGRALGFGARPAVLVVDLLEGFTDPASPLGGDLDEVVAASARVLDAARDAAAPVLFTTTVYDAAGERAAEAFLRKVPALRILRPGTRWIEVDPRLRRRDDEAVIVKRFASAFHGTDLATLLARGGCDTLVVCGASTSGCVRASAVDALQHAFVPVVAREAVGDRWAAAHEANLFDLEQKYADVAAVDDVVAALSAAGREGPGAVHEPGQLAAERP
jgi:maleamate amidohydrolase